LGKIEGRPPQTIPAVASYPRGFRKSSGSFATFAAIRREID